MTLRISRTKVWALMLASLTAAVVLAVGIQFVARLSQLQPAPWVELALPILPIVLVGIYILRRR